MSRARFNRKHLGPRPVRFRDQFWGRNDLTKHEYVRVVESNTLYVNSLGLMERVSSRQGLHFWEHPEDPGEQPFPSIWNTDEMLELERRVDASCVSFDQCVFGAPVPKGTTISTTCPVPEVFHQARCPGLSSLHQHTGVSQGVNSEGLFHTRRLQTYPPRLCEAIAEMLLLGLQKMKLNGLGPTGFMRVKGSVAPLSAWSTSANAKHQFGVHVMNEAVALKQRKHLSKVQGAMYLHVDDTVVITQKGAAVHADDLMQAVAENYEDKGFIVPERVSAKEVVKVVGFEIDSNRGEFRLPLKKQILLHDALLHTATQGAVDVEVLRMLVGVWMHGAQLNRDLMSLPFVVYHFMEVFENEFARLWPSVKRELIAMARSVVFMRCDISRAFSNIIWASDAQGAGEGDHGGFGITASWLTEAERSDICESAETWGHTVARLSGDLSGVRNPFKELVPTKPFTLLPSPLFDSHRWVDVLAGRWKFEDHITLGEARAVQKIVDLLGNDVRMHEKIHISLQDNQPCAAAYTKGRSSVWSIMYILRKKPAVCLATSLKLILPWVESGKMPADSLSRRQD